MNDSIFWRRWVKPTFNYKLLSFEEDDNRDGRNQESQGQSSGQGNTSNKSAGWLNGCENKEDLDNMLKGKSDEWLKGYIEGLEDSLKDRTRSTEGMSTEEAEGYKKAQQEVEAYREESTPTVEWNPDAPFDNDLITPEQMAKLAREAGEPISELDGANKDPEEHLEEWIEQHKEGLANIGKGSEIGSLLDRVNKFKQKIRAMSLTYNPAYEAKLKDLFGGASHPDYNITIGRGYDYVDPIARESILFIGMNPSYGIPQPGYTNPDQLKYMYFSRIHKILKYVNNATHTNYGFAYIDLYYVRETSQKLVEEMEKAMPGFFRDQLSITKQIIADARPNLIVVVNAAASKRFQDEYKQNWLGYNMRKGADIYEIASDQVPVLFSGMLSGQRALDNGSFKSLKWHIVHILSQQSY